MILCVDIGNTSIKMARVAGSRVFDRMSRPSDDSAERIARLLRRVARDGFDAAAIASVRPQSTAAVRAMIRRDLGVEPLVVTSRVMLPVKIATRRPARVGVDRICAACGALAGGGRNAIVVDAGSAITVDLVLDNRFLGGLIMPGPQMMLSAMHRFTAQLPDLALTDDSALPFDDTAPAMRTGVVVGSAGAIEGAVEHLRRKAGGRRIPVYLTGGHARRLQNRLPSGWKYKPDLMLIGLAAIARANLRRR
ncbi:MAG TPA: type III pantothenate kinase [Candidatus Krumholzibacteria bacterium]|nr:type III pantothenate kinase [Candidatus Krumholzibacteria bacterium]